MQSITGLMLRTCQPVAAGNPMPARWLSQGEAASDYHEARP